MIIGAGPAGLAAASYSSRAGLDTLVIDQGAPGGQLLIIDQIENYPGYPLVSGFELAQKMEEQAAQFGAEIEFTQALSVEKKDGLFSVTTTDGPVSAKAVILAMGARHRHLDVPGESDYEGKGVSYCATCDGPFFKGKHVAVVGGGDTALTDALYLAKICSRVSLIHRRNEFRAQKALQDRVRKEQKISVMTPHTVKEIRGDGNTVTSILLDDGSELECDGVFIFAGIIPQSELVSGLVQLDRNGFIVSNDRMETSEPGIYAAGDIRTTAFRQVVTAAGDGAMAAHMADEYISAFEKNRN